MGACVKEVKEWMDNMPIEAARVELKRIEAELYWLGQKKALLKMAAYIDEHLGANAFA